MKKTTWTYTEKELRNALKMPKSSTGKGYKKKNRIRWTAKEEKYLMSNIADLGIETVSINLKRSPIAVRSKFLRLSGLIDKKGRMTTSLKDNPINKLIPVIPENKMSKKAEVTVEEPVKVVTKVKEKSQTKKVQEVKNNAETKKVDRTSIIALVFSLLSLGLSALVILKFIL